MIIAGTRGTKIFKLNLPEHIVGNYMLKDNNNNVIGTILAENDNWVIYPNEGCVLNYNGINCNSAILENYSQFSMKKLIHDETYMLFAYPSVEENILEVVTKKSKITIGSGNGNDITYGSNLLKSSHATLTYNKEKWYIECNQDCLVYVNDRLAKRKRLGHGDSIFLYGLKLVCIHDFILIMNLVKNNQINLNQTAFEKRQIVPQQIDEDAIKKETEENFFNPAEQFRRSPRFKTAVEHTDITLSAPPEQDKQKTQPALLVIGPQLTMMLTSAVNLFTTLNNVASGNTTFTAAIPSIILTAVMMVSAFLWPSLTRKWNKHEERRKELKRIRRYRLYLDKKDKEITETLANQKQILLENNVTLEQCQQIIYQRKRNLWERTIEDEDFLTVRIGTGMVAPDIKISYSEDEFTMDDDLLKDEVNDFIKKYNYVEDVPLNISLIENRVSAIIGNPAILQTFMESIMLQLMTFHVYNELKIVILTDEGKANDWDFVKFLPHCWDNQKTRRFIAATPDEKKKIASYLEGVIKEREEAYPQEKGKTEDVAKAATMYKNFNSYYLIITDDIESARKIEVINNILAMKRNLGVSILIKNDRIANLPNQCTSFINVNEDISGMFKNNLNEENQKQFKADLNKMINVEDCVQQLANIYVPVPKEKHELPKSVGFLEMYGVGNVEQFNSIDRWKTNNPVVSLAVPVGIDQQGELFNMDIHEKAYGPHGLVAGTTGSGKSEWIITYILSLAVNFSPLEVQFVLIDYKGGGLAGSFENKETGIKLPHLVGTITNLDKSEIRRSIASLEAESKRRQRMFNEAREKINDSSMNIYKYQQYYRKGMLDEPLSHLFIISDEFAELKSQEPEFLEQLVSIARIGRSLGIHLILATQKPAGVVDEQMWSNSRFKVCLRVQDKQDSNDMIKCDDAAFLKQTGAFYLQVGLNEFFGLGQSAYAGAKYKPTNVVKKKIETSLDVIDRTGDVIDEVDYIEQEDSNTTAQGEELLNIIRYLSGISKNEHLTARRLWLDSMPENIYVDTIKQQYGFTRTPYIIEPIVAEYDDPYQQLQNKLQVTLNESNLYISGASGSGKEQLLQSMIYSIITNYTPQEVNIYICDFGAETLGMFEEAPHVGDVVYANDTVKIQNIIRFMKKEIKERRSRYREFGGSYENYIKYSKTKEQLIIVVINGISFIKETLSEEFDELELLLVDSIKYGIVFVETSLDTSTHKAKAFSSFGNILMLKSNDYVSVLGADARGINPKELKGRGLFKQEGSIYEFQTAKICPEDTMQNSVKTVCKKLLEIYKVKAKSIPMIPSTISFDKLDKDKININSICVGFSKVSISPVYFDLQKNQATLFIGTKKSQIRNYIRVLNQELDVAAEKGTKVYLFDPEDTLKMDHYNKITYVESIEIQNTMKNLLIYINGEYEKYNNLEDKSKYKAPSRSLLVFYCSSQVYSLCGGQLKDQFGQAFDKARELGLFDFVYVDVVNDFKEIQRDKSILRLFVESTGVCMGNAADTQMTVELSVRDIRVREGLEEKEGYIIDKGKGKLSQILQFESTDDEEEK